MEVSQARYFLAVTRAGHFTRAAERCNVSQPALTSSIKKLENELGAPLFHRDRKGPSLTVLGRMILPHAERLLESSVAVVDAAEDFGRLKNVPLRIGVLTTLGPSRLALALEVFRTQAPEVELEVHILEHRELIRKLEEAELEVAIGTNSLSDSPDWLIIQELYQENYVVLLPPGHALCALESISLAELDGLDYIDRLACEFRDLVVECCGLQNVRLYASYRTTSEAWIECLVRAGIGFAFMPEFSVLSPDAITRPLLKPALKRSISLLRSVDYTMSPAAQLFWKTLKEYQ
ncbi:MAG: LysR family transcriptional regulator [Kofleriaceae bacterium]|nr:LysR family transcriptional regulator [Kofleriaceae bacterium]